ncbi:MAG: type II secretion system GspH family protein [Lachnospiraceae bacterium]|nr:type II secretion system GspH family protein [Ruminococcus sp.]MCM1276133.1 type II secretion system GspH family protein [Lachnospiraceae bacterium]
MIKTIHNMRKRRGFTMTELIVVIAVIAILAAMILPSLDTHKAAIDDACSASRDMYNALQSIFTKYSLTEAVLDLRMKDDETAKKEFVCFYKRVGGNYLHKPGVSIEDMPPSLSLYIEVNAEGGVIKGVRFDNSLSELLTKTNANGAVTAEVLKRDLESRVDVHDGYYYAEVRYLAASAPSPGAAVTNVNPIKVKFAAYTKNKISGCTAESVKFKSHCVTYGGQVVGVFAPYNTTAGGTMGDKDSVLGNDDPTDEKLPGSPSPTT